MTDLKQVSKQYRLYWKCPPESTRLHTPHGSTDCGKMSFDEALEWCKKHEVRFVGQGFGWMPTEAKSVGENGIAGRV
jgi:hypothetical protein